MEKQQSDDFVYIVTQGTYDDYQILEVFSNEELAKEYADLVYDSCVETWPITNERFEVKREAWSCGIREDGYLRAARGKEGLHYHPNTGNLVLVGTTEEIIKGFDSKPLHNEEYAYIGRVISYVSEEHCRNLADKLYKEYLEYNEKYNE